MEVYRFPQTIKVQDHPHVDDEGEDEVLLRPEHGRQRELHPGGGGAAGEPHLQPPQYIISEIDKFSLLWGEAQFALCLLIEKKIMTYSDPVVT